MKIDWLRDKAGVLAERNFRRFYTGYVTSLLGTSMSSIALTWAVFDSHYGTTALGLVMFATLALLPTMLENLMNYPVLTTGLVTAPRGIGSVKETE